MLCACPTDTSPDCQLCTNAKYTLSDVWNIRPFHYEEIDVMTPEGKIWRDLYEFDTPVIHVSKAAKGEELVKQAGKAVKLMHRFTAEEVTAKMDAVEQEPIH
ncbi:glutaredoxin-like protein [Coleophoma cylindrospora]|uniref:Glutaredoxin-like protein n=1 Tax=Coleophoma cylindrospora TaxID=1849047 RepID=A0A3D8RLR8_9HELO|nr:glutaredoxin-like protein [Coleophoma cylindrospora]